MPGYDVPGLVANFTSPYGSGVGQILADSPSEDHPTNIGKLAQVLRDCYWQETESNLERIRLASTIKDAAGIDLDKWAKTLDLTRGVDEVDAKLRIRVYAAIRQRLGLSGIQGDRIVEFLEVLLGAQAGDIEIIDNYPTPDMVIEDYRPAYFIITFPVSLLEGLGFLPTEYLSVIAIIDDVLVSAAGAGILGEVYVQGGGEWDVDAWDSPSAVYAP